MRRGPWSAGFAKGKIAENIASPCNKGEAANNDASLMREVGLKNAKASLSSLVYDASRGEPSIITQHGKPRAVIVGFEDRERLARVPSFGRLLLPAAHWAAGPAAAKSQADVAG
jgi:antitoxin Phd